ncbi:hypothetical protein R4514_18730, partial [Acinetobacter baumannii]|nr:hypothetical protein [Acinetobacter baumannii]
MKGDILGGGQGVINTVLNQAMITQKALTVTDLPSIYVDKKEIVNTKQDIVDGIFLSNSSYIIPIYNSSQYNDSGLHLKYNIENKILDNYYGDNFAFLIESDVYLDFKKIINFKIDRTSEITSIEVNFTSDELSKFMPDLLKGYRTNNDYKESYKIKVLHQQNSSFFEIASGRQEIIKDNHNIFVQDVYHWSYLIGQNSTDGILFYSKNNIRLYNQPAETNQVIVYYRELGSNSVYTKIDAKPLMDVYGEAIAGAFDINFNSVLDSTKKYEIQYVALAGKDIVNRQQGTIEFNSAGMQVNTTPLNYGGDGFVLFSGTDIQFIDQFKPVTSTSTSAKLKIRKVGTTVWEQFALNGTSNWFSWNGNQGRDGEYEFQLDSFNGTTQTTPSGSIIGKLRLGSQPKVLSYIPKSFAQNQITFAGQPTGSSKVTVKYGTAAGLLNKTAVLTVGSDGKAILDATDLAEQNLVGSTT